MDGEAKLPARAAAVAVRPTSETTSSSTSSTLSSSSSPPGLIRHVQAAFKRHRALGTMQSNDLRPRRMMVPSRALRPTVGSTVDSKKSQEAVPSSEGRSVKESTVQSLQSKSMVSHVKGTQDNPSMTAPFLSATITQSFDDGCNTFDMQIDQPKSSASDKDKSAMPLPNVESQIDRLKKVQFSVGETVISQGAADGMATERKLSSHVSSLALTETEWNHSHTEASNAINHDLKQQVLSNLEVDVTSRSDIGISSSLAKRTALAQDQLQQFRNFLNQPATTQSSGIGTSCATTTSVHSTSAPMLNSTTYTSRSRRDEVPQLAVEPLGDLKTNCPSVTQGHLLQSPELSMKETSAMSGREAAITDEASMHSLDAPMEDKKYNSSKEESNKTLKEVEIRKESCSNIDQSIQAKETAAHNGIQSQALLCKESSLEEKIEPSQSGKQEKAGSSRGAPVSRKRNYDPDCFFKVNGKLYQRLGKIGSGGSSEVHKVISSDCTIYALKKIKLKGRDYATAYGFCQEMEYLNKLKGKDNIIQLIDYEVTDKTLLQEVMNGSMSNKDGKVKVDGYIYMVLEYGEIDLARMLSQKWKELDSSDKTIDENWLRFYWQQILLAVNTIHEERIVHSDLKPANFLLVRGSLKLIDFGIAKAISSDTTNIQRDSQVGTLSYMSPEAFMCNESDANGNVIKCGRPSDIWSLGCILYQMVYGRTPFSEYRTFWAKFKVITDPNHEITYEPVTNPWLLDLMKKCLAWDRNQRWRIPQLLEHPFLVPPVPSHISTSQGQGCEMVRIISEACGDHQEASDLCHQLRQVLEEPMSVLKSQSSVTSRDQQCILLSHVSKLCLHIRQHLTKSEQC